MCSSPSIQICVQISTEAGWCANLHRIRLFCRSALKPLVVESELTLLCMPFCFETDADLYRSLLVCRYSSKQVIVKMVFDAGWWIGLGAGCCNHRRHWSRILKRKKHFQEEPTKLPTNGSGIRTIPRPDNSPTGQYPDGQFLDGQFPEDISPTGQFPDSTIPRPDNTPTGQFLNGLVPQTDVYLAEFCPFSQK